MDSRAREVIKIGDKLFGMKRTIDSLHQEIALNFYPERADFTEERTGGEEFADHLWSSYPVLARRELGNMLSASLRPRSQKWFSIHCEDEDTDKGQTERAYLEHISNIQWKAMYERSTGFVRSTKQADHDFAAFGNAVIKVSLNPAGDALLFRNFHLRDCAWAENAAGDVDHVHRKWKPTAAQLEYFFPKTISGEVRRALKKDPNKTFNVRHVVIPSRLYKPDTKNRQRLSLPYTSLYVETESETVLEEVGLDYNCYVIPRWQTVSGSQYGVSMATGICLPDGRTMQVVLRTMREAGEKYVDPPMIAVGDAIRGDIALYAGGVTNADIEYDERLGEVLRPITQNRGGMPIAFEIAEALRADIQSAFFLDKIQLPAPGTDMTAFEVRRRLEEHIRSASPIFEPIEQEYNNPLCEVVFGLLVRGGGFPVNQMPPSLSNKDVRFTFRSPLADMSEQQDAEIFMDVMNRIWLPSAQIDPAQLENIEMTTAVRDAAKAGGWKASWLKDPKAVEEKRQQMQAEAEQQRKMVQMGQMGEVAEQGGKGAQEIQKAMVGGAQNGA